MNSNVNVLVVDDEPSLREFLEIMLRKEGYGVLTAIDGVDALEKTKNNHFHLIILDIQMPRMTGIDFLRKFQNGEQDCKIIMLTAFASHTTAIDAMKLGAFDYITKPFKIDEIKLVIRKALEQTNLEDENKRIKKELKGKFGVEQLIGNSPQTAQLHEMINRLGDVSVNILITGESGTGKELVARALHYSGPRCHRPFVAVNCGAIPETLMESELFGYKQGAFTGATSDKKGLFEEADGGTVFLDEIADLPLQMQVKLLRVIEEKNIRPLGGTRGVPIDFRIISATNQNLEQYVSENKFRHDLYYRLNVVLMHITPLRERKEDIAPLTVHFLKKYSEEIGKGIKGLTPLAMEILENYNFPGNVRELENIIARCVALVEGDTIGPEALPKEVLGYSDVDVKDTLKAEINIDSIIDNVEKEILEKTMAKAGGKKKKAADMLGITLRSLRYRLVKHGLDDD